MRGCGGKERQRGAGKRALGAGPALLCHLTSERRVPCLTPLQGLTLPPLALGAVPRRAAAPPGLEGTAGRAGYGGFLAAGWGRSAGPEREAVFGAGPALRDREGIPAPVRLGS